MPRLAAFEAPTTRTTLETLARLVARMMRGKINVTGTFTIAAGTVETTITDAEFGATTVLVPMATTPAGQALLFRTFSRGKGSLTLGHTAPVADETFDYIALG